MIRVLEQLLESRDAPVAIRCDNGPEFVSQAFVQWAAARNIRLDYSQPGNPQQNAYIERYNRTVRSGWVNKHCFDTLEKVQHNGFGFIITNAPLKRTTGNHP